MKAPLQAEGLARRVYPFLGLAIVGLVSLRGFGAIIASPPLLVATGLGALLVLAPLVPFEPPSVGRLPSAIPVLLGFGLALYPLWASGSIVGIVVLSEKSAQCTLDVHVCRPVRAVSHRAAALRFAGRRAR